MVDIWCANKVKHAIAGTENTWQTKTSSKQSKFLLKCKNLRHTWECWLVSAYIWTNTYAPNGRNKTI